MAESGNWFIREFKKVLPPVLFFFVAFCLGDWTDRIMNQYAMTTYSFFSIVVASLVMGKVVLISDELPFIDIFSKKPLIYPTIWKTVIYVLIAGVFRLLEHTIPAFRRGDSFQEVWAGLVEHVERPVFLLAHAWLTVLFLVFVGYRELIAYVGHEKVYNAFFKSSQKTDL